jgi:hypothetical protein
LFSIISFCATFAGQAGSLKPAAIPSDSLKIHIKYGDVSQDGSINIFDLISILRHLSGSEQETSLSDLDNNGKTNIFDLLTFLHEFAHLSESPPEEGFKVAASIGDYGHRLTEPVVYSYSTFKNKKEVYDTYKIYSNREIVKVEFVFAGDTLTQIEGKTPVFFSADPDTIKYDWIKPLPLSEPKEWKIRVWDAQGNCASDSGISKFMILLPDIGTEGSTSNVGNEIEFPLILKGAWQRFGIKVGYMYSIFVVNLNAEGRESIVYNNIDDLAVAIMEEVVSNDSLWHSTDVFGDPWPTLFIAPAVSRQTELKTNRLITKNGTLGPRAVPIPLDGNEKLVSLIGFPKWIRSSSYIMTDENYKPDSVIYNRYKSRK